MKIFWSEEIYKKMLYCILNKVSSIWEAEFLLREPNTVLDIFLDQIYVILGLFKGQRFGFSSSKYMRVTTSSHVHFPPLY